MKLHPRITASLAAIGLLLTLTLVGAGAAPGADPKASPMTEANITRLTAGAGPWLWLMGLVAIALPHLVQSSFFDTRLTNWVGLVTRKPVTEDYAPLLPWIGVMWWGLAAGQWVLKHQREWVTGALPTALSPLATLGRWSLSFYMLHQPVLIGLLMAVRELK